MAKIKDITMISVEESVSATTDTIDIEADKDILFEFTFECKQGERAPDRIIYNLYTNIIGHTEVIASVENSAPLRGNRLTVSCPERYAGARLFASFALEGDNPAMPLPGINLPTVKCLNVKSAVTGAPMIKNVYWAISESVEYGNESLQRSDIKRNEDAFLHIHTRGLFGKRVKVELFGSDAFSPWVPASENLLQSRIYTVPDNVLGVAVSMSTISSRAGLRQLKAVVSCPEAKEKFTSNPLDLDRFNNSDAPSRIESKLGTSKFVVGELPNREIKPPETPPEPIDADLNVVVGTFSFLSGIGTEQATRIRASGETGKGSTYRTYQLDTHELKLQHLIDAGIITRQDVTEMVDQTDSEGNVSSVEQLKTTRIYKASYEGTEIYGFKDAFRNTVCDKLSFNDKRGEGLDYARLKLIRAAIRHSGEQAIDSRPLCRSAWELKSYNRFKQDPFRYSSNQECPPGAFYLVPCHGGKYLMYVGDAPNSANIKYWTCTTLTDDKTKREEIQQPENTDNPRGYVSSARSGIAFHRGRCVASIGCITLDTSYGDSNKRVELELFNHIFSGNNGEYKPKTTYSTASPTQKHTDSIRKLHLIMIEERRAALRPDVSANDYNPYNRYKGE